VNDADGLLDPDRVLEPDLTTFVEQHVQSLLAWDIIVYFHRNPDSAIGREELAARLGRRAEEVEPEVLRLSQTGLLALDDGMIRYSPSEDAEKCAGRFVAACHDRNSRLALIALVLHRMGATSLD